MSFNTQAITSVLSFPVVTAIATTLLLLMLI